MKSIALTLTLCTLAAAAFAAAPGPGPGQGPGNAPLPGNPNRPDNRPVPLTGILKSYNLNPKGQPESFLADTDKGLIQVNFPPDFAPTLTKAVPLGSKLDASIAPDGPPRPPAGGPQDGPQGGPPGGPQGGPRNEPQPAHPVFRLVSLNDGKGTQITPPRPTPQHIEGTVSALNYDRRAALNGAQLDSGDLLLFGPREAQQLSLKIGDKVSADGPAEKLPSGKLALHAQQLNGQDLRPNRQGPDGPPPPPPTSDGGPGGPPPQP